MEFEFSGARKGACLEKEALLYQANGCPLIEINEVGGLWCKKKSLSGKQALLSQADGCHSIKVNEV